MERQEFPMETEPAILLSASRVVWDYANRNPDYFDNDSRLADICREIREKQGKSKSKKRKRRKKR